MGCRGMERWNYVGRRFTLTNREFEAKVRYLEQRVTFMKLEKRKQAVNDLIEEYLAARGDLPPHTLLDRLSNVILADELRDATNKRRSNDKPAIYTDKQLMRPMGNGRSQKARIEYGAEDM